MIAVKVIAAVALTMLVSGGARADGLCHNGWPAKRDPYVTYGGLPTRPGMVRDHVVPLCLGGADSAANIQYQTYQQGRAKDALERCACETYCSNPSAALLATLRNQFQSRKE
jgi:hypothetical protein